MKRILGTGLALSMVVALTIAVYLQFPPRRTLVLLAAGQSNAGNNAALLSHSEHGSRVIEFFRGKLYIARDPMRGGGGAALGSPWVALGNALIEKGVYDNVVIAMVVKDGSSIAEWRTGGDLNAQLASVSAALAKAGMPATVIAWVQGEAERYKDSEYQDQKKYGEALGEVIAAARSGAPQSKFYVAQASWCPLDPVFTGPVQAVRNAQAAAVGGSVFPGPDLDAIDTPQDRRDNCHLSEPGLRKFVAEWVRILAP